MSRLWTSIMCEWKWIVYQVDCVYYVITCTPVSGLFRIQRAPLPAMMHTDNASVDPPLYIIVLDEIFEIKVSLNVPATNLTCSPNSSYQQKKFNGKSRKLQYRSKYQGYFMATGRFLRRCHLAILRERTATGFQVSGTYILQRYLSVDSEISLEIA
jgi:hypothetical protein